MEEFDKIIESMVDIPHLREAILEAYHYSLNGLNNGRLVHRQKNRPIYFKRNQDGSLTDEEIDSRISALKKNHDTLNIGFDEDRVRKDMIEHPKMFRKPIPTAPMKSMEDSGNVVREMDLPSQEEFRHRCYKESILTIAQFYRKYGVMDFDVTGTLKKVELADQEAASRGVKFPIDRSKYPFPKLDTIDDVLDSKLVGMLSNGNLPFKTCIDKAIEFYDEVQARTEQGEDQLASFIWWNKINTMPPDTTKKQ